MEIDASIDPPVAGELTHRSWDRTIGDLARGQHGLVGRGQLLRLGMTKHEIDGRLARGSLHEMHRGVYVVGVRRLSRKGRWMAAVLAAGPRAVLSHRAAGVVWGLLPPSLNRIEVSCPRGARTRRPGIVCRESDLAADELDEIDGIPVTSPFRTMIDLAAVLESRQLERAWNELKVRGHTDRVPMSEMLARHRGKRGTIALRNLLGSTRPEGVTSNEFEEAFVALLDAHGLPRPRLNATLSLRGRFYEIDCLWEPQGLALELDSREVHATSRAFEGDRRRDRVLLAEGYRTSRVTWRQLRNEPDEIVTDLRSSLGQ